MDGRKGKNELNIDSVQAKNENTTHAITSIEKQL